MSIEINDSVTWLSDNKHQKNRMMRGVVKNIIGNVAIVQRGDMSFKLYLNDLTLDGAITLTREDYRKKVVSVANEAGCSDDTVEANALREIANLLFEQLEIALFGNDETD